MESVVDPIVQKIRRERLLKTRPVVRAGDAPADLEAILRRCGACSNASIHIHELSSTSAFKSLNDYKRAQLDRIFETKETCEACTANELAAVFSLYCQYRRKNRVDLQLVAEKGEVTSLTLVDIDGHVWPLPEGAARSSFDMAIIDTPRPERCDTIKLGSVHGLPKKGRKSNLQQVQRVLVDFEGSRLDDPLIFGPRQLPARVLNEATEAYARLDDAEVPLVIVGLNKASPGREGILLSNERLHSSEEEFPPIAFEEISEVELRKGLLGSGIFVNNLKLMSVKGFLETNAPHVIKVLKQLANLEELTKAPPKRAPVPKRPSKPTGRRRRSADGVLIRADDIRARETLLPIPRSTLDEMLQALVERKVPGDLLHVFEIPAEFIESAKRDYARTTGDDEPVVLVRSNLGDDASEALITDSAVYSNELNAPRGLRFAALRDITLTEEDGAQYLDVNGAPFLSQGLLPSWVLPKLKDILEQAASYNASSAPAVAPEELDEPAPEAGGAHAPPAGEPPRQSRLGRRMRRSRGAGLAPPPAPERRPSSADLPPPDPRRRPTSAGRRFDRGSRPSPRDHSSTHLPAPQAPPPPRPEVERRQPLRPAAGPGPRSAPPDRRRPTGPAGPQPRDRASRITAPPTRGGRRRPTEPPSQRSGLHPQASRPLPRPQAPPGIELDAVDFDIELAQQANRQWRAGRLDEALRLVEEALLVNPLNAELNYARAALLASLGEATAALDALLQAARYGFHKRERLLGDPSWARLRRDPDFGAIVRKVEERSRSDDPERLEQIRLGFVYMLAEMADQLPAEVRVTRCPACGDVRLDPAQADYDFMWDTVEGFHLEAIAPLTMEQLPCYSCDSFAVEIIGTVHAFPLGRDYALHLVYWLDGGQARARFLFQGDPQGYLQELRTYTTLRDARQAQLDAETDSLVVRLSSPASDIVECAVRDLSIPGHREALPALQQVLEQSALSLDAKGRCTEPWLIREALESVVTIGLPEGLDAVFATVAALLTHETINEAVAFACVQACQVLGGQEVLGELFHYIEENIRNASPAVTELFAEAIEELSAEAGDTALAARAHALASAGGR